MKTIKNTELNAEQLRAHARTHNKENSWWLTDAKGIPCCRICGECAEAARAKYKPEIFNRRKYSDVVEEKID